MREFQSLRHDLEWYRASAIPALVHHPEIFGPYRNSASGKDIVLVGAGPTLNLYTPLPNAIHIGVNRSFLAKNVNLDYLFIADGGSIESRELENYRKKECVKFFGYHHDHPISESFAMKCGAKRFYFTHHRPKSPFAHVPVDIAHQPLVCCYSIIMIAFQFALWCQPRRIYIVGCDAANNGYFTSSKDRPEQWLHNDIVKEWQLLAEFAQKHYPDIEIISINPVGLKGMFTDATMAEGKLVILSPEK